MLHLYRCLLLLYPKAYRQNLAEEMIVVFLQAQRAFEGQAVQAKVKFYLRELGGLVVGGFRERIHLVHRPLMEGPMRSFRFPGWTIALMLLLLLELVAAIELTRIVSIKTLSLGEDVSWAWLTPDFAVGAIALMGAFGLVAYALLFVTGRTGIQRLPQVRTWPSKDAGGGSRLRRG